MGDAIKHGFANLTNFNGSDDRPTFWWWVLFVVIVTFAINMITGIVFVASSVGGMIEGAASGADEAQMQAEMMQSMAGSLETQTWVGIGVSFLGLFFILASFARRLRNAGLPVFIAGVPIVATAISSYLSIQLVGEMSAVMAGGDVAAMEAMSTSSAGYGLLGWLGYLVVIVCGVWPSKST